MRRRLLSFVFLFVIFYCNGQIEDLENLEKITEKGFWKTNISNLFSDFTNFGDPLTLSGGVDLQLRSYNAFGGENRQDPFFYSLGANLNTRVYSINLPFSLLVTAKNTTSSVPNFTELKNAFRDDLNAKKQNLIRFGISPHYKWIKLHLGHRIMNFSKFSVSNLNFYGVGAELNPGNIRIAALRGRLSDATPIDLSLTEPNFQPYERNGWGVKLGYGNENEFLDLVMFSAEDDISNQFTDEDVVPEANAVLGLVGKKKLFNRISLLVDYAYSGYSPNALDSELDKNTPLSFLHRNTTSTIFKDGLEVGATYEGKSFNLGLQYRRIEPEFRSFGAYFFNNDILEYTARTEFKIVNKINTSLNIGIQENNLDLQRQSTTTRLVYGLGMNYAAEKFSCNLNLSNNVTDVGYVLNQNLDSLNVVLINQNAGLSLTYGLTDKGGNMHSFLFNTNVQKVSDDLEDPVNSNNSLLISSSATHVYNISDAKFKISSRLIYNQNRIANDMTVNRYGIGAGVSKSLLEEKLTLGLDINYFLNTVRSAENSSNFRNALNIQYKLSDALSTQMSWSYLSSTVSQAGRLDELVGLFSIQHNFSATVISK